MPWIFAWRSFSVYEPSRARKDQPAFHQTSQQLARLVLLSRFAKRMREMWTHLADGRWIERIVSTNNGSAYYPAFTNRFVWDGQVLMAVLDHTNGLVMSFMRGLDSPGSPQGAGGVGGVLAVAFKTNGTHFVSYDGNGNVAALCDASNGTGSGQFEYGPFSEPIRVTGAAAQMMPLRFSTMYEDSVTGGRKYLFRDLAPSTGRWKSRDPIGEEGGLNLYGFVGNDPVRLVDPLGLEALCYYDDHGVWTCRSPLQSCKACRCKKVSVSPDPNQRPQVFGGTQPGTVLAGFPVPVKVEVDGDISKCKCKHQDKGTVTVGWPMPTPLDMTSEREIDCSYPMDAPGYNNIAPPAPGQTSEQYRFAYALTITVTCTDSDGKGFASGSGTLPPGPFWFKLQTDPSGNVTTVPTTPAQ